MHYVEIQMVDIFTLEEHFHNDSSRLLHSVEYIESRP